MRDEAKKLKAVEEKEEVNQAKDAGRREYAQILAKTKCCEVRHPRRDSSPTAAGPEWRDVGPPGLF